jgi:hypothetical protein
MERLLGTIHCELLQLIVIVTEVTVNPTIQSKIRYNSSWNPGHVTIWISPFLDVSTAARIGQHFSVQNKCTVNSKFGQPSSTSPPRAHFAPHLSPEILHTGAEAIPGAQ